jgi:hypothetical protein
MAAPRRALTPVAAMTAAQTVHVILVNRVAGEPAALLVEREPGIVEFPALTLTAEEADDQDAIAARIRALTGLEATVGGLLDAGIAGDRFLLARVVGGSPRLTVAHLGWEWRPLARLLTLQFIPKPMANELRSYMYG